MSVDLSGRWRIEGRPEGDSGTGKGEIEISLRQHGDDLTGELIQTIDPWTGAPPADPESTRAQVIGRVYPAADDGVTLVVLHRLNIHDGFRAIFTGIVDQTATTIRGHVVNSRANTGRIVMQKTDAATRA
jgi:hypothetical protein